MQNYSLEKTRQLIKISTLYYIDGLSQQEISQRMHISRSQISRILSQARESGIVSININNPYSSEHRYENWLIKKFGIKNAVVIDVAEDNIVERNFQMSYAMSDILDAHLTEHCTFGVMAGTSINSVSLGIGYSNHSGVLVAPMVGGVGSEGKWQANLNAKNFSEKFGSHCLHLNAPVIVAEPQTCRALLKEPEISYVLNRARSSSVALIGIGQLKYSDYYEPGFLTKSEFQEMLSKGAQTSIGNTFIDRNGKVLSFSGDERMIGLTAKEIKEIPTVIAISYGTNKVPAIIAALSGGWIDILVTTLNTVETIYNYFK